MYPSDPINYPIVIRIQSSVINPNSVVILCLLIIFSSCFIGLNTITILFVFSLNFLFSLDKEQLF